jgi:aspartate/methionine/tyrosine aminotransferase
MGRIITDITAIESHANSETFFISGWDKDPATMNISIPVIADAAKSFKKKQNTYFFMSENEENKKYFFDNIISKNRINIDIKNISIAPNGTSGLFLGILSLKHEFNVSNIALVSPTYFTNINVIQMLGLNLFYYQANIFDNDIIDFGKLRKMIISNNIEALIVTDPLFGTGIPINEINYGSILNIAKELGIWVIIDYIYGGMEWKQPIRIINKFMIELINDHPKTMIVESISKRLFLNGIKFAIIYTNFSLIQAIETNSESFIGSSSYVQNELFKRIYEPSNIPVIIKHIKNNIEHVKLTFNGIKSAILGKGIFLSDCISGYFALAGIPASKIKGLRGNKASLDIIDKVNILTIPHNRYLFETKDYYCFRVNLSMDRALLLQGINKLLDAYP